MTNRDILAVALKILGVISVITLIMSIPIIGTSIIAWKNFSKQGFNP